MSVLGKVATASELDERRTIIAGKVPHLCFGNEPEGRSVPEGMNLEPQGSTGAAELLFRLSTFGFSLLSPHDQGEAIHQIASQARGIVIKRLAEESEEDFRCRAFTELFDEVSVTARIHLMKDFTEKFFLERRMCDLIVFFMKLGSMEQQNVIENLLRDVRGVKIEVFEEESEENFRLKRFMKLCKAHPIVWDHLGQPQIQQSDRNALIQTLDNEDIQELKQSRYAEFYLGLLDIWFQAPYPNSAPTNLMSRLLEVKVEELDFRIDKLPNETEVDFRLRRYIELFKQLELSYQELIVKYMEDTLFRDLGYHVEIRLTGGSPLWEEIKSEIFGLEYFFALEYSGNEYTGTFHDEFMKVKILNLRGDATTSQGGGGGQGTTQR